MLLNELYNYHSINRKDFERVKELLFGLNYWGEK